MQILVSDHACYVVQAFTVIEERLVADMPLDVSDPSEAARLALDLRSCKAGVVAFEWSEEMQYGEPYVMAKFGRIPEECLAWGRNEGDTEE